MPVVLAGFGQIFWQKMAVEAELELELNRTVSLMTLKDNIYVQLERHMVFDDVASVHTVTVNA